MDAAATRRWQVSSGVLAGFSGLALLFCFTPPWGGVPDPGPAVLAPGALAPGSRRAPIVEDPPVVHLGGFDRDCQDCHQLFDTALLPSQTRVQHRDIELQHGMNDRCSNCHDAGNRNLLRPLGGDSLLFSESYRLCARCHGPTFRDWETHAHGRSTGSWDTADPRRGRLICVSCHDPHAPAYPPMAPLPAPNTLRMGESVVLPHHDAGSPLMGRSPNGHATPKEP